MSPKGKQTDAERERDREDESRKRLEECHHNPPRIAIVKILMRSLMLFEPAPVAWKARQAKACDETNQDKKVAEGNAANSASDKDEATRKRLEARTLVSELQRVATWSIIALWLAMTRTARPRSACVEGQACPSQR